MYKYFILIVTAVLLLTTESLSFGQPAGGGFGGSTVGLEGMGGMGRGMRIGPRPAKAERLSSVKELEKQVAVLRAAFTASSWAGFTAPA